MPSVERAVPILKVINLETTFPIKSGILRRTTGEIQAVSKVSFNIYQGETLGLVGESGCGKSTVARTIVGLEKAKNGHVYFKGNDLTKMNNKNLRALRRDIQFIFQDPDASLNPRMTVRELLTEPWKVHRGIVEKGKWGIEVRKLMELVGLDPDRADNYPHQFSGGQRQRICIARALALKPKLIICDEAVSALDVSIQAQILNLLDDLKKQLGLSYLFISHDLSVVQHICDRVAVMYLGKIVEIGKREEIYSSPSHPYTQALLSAAPIPQPWLVEKRNEILLEGDIPSPANPPSGCRFRTRCWKAKELCAKKEPELKEYGEGQGHPSACHFSEVDNDVIPVLKSR